MGFWDSLFGTKAEPAGAQTSDSQVPEVDDPLQRRRDTLLVQDRVEIDLEPVMQLLHRSVDDWLDPEPEPELLLARLGDACRWAQQMPAEPEQVMATFGKCSESQLRTIGLALDILRESMPAVALSTIIDDPKLTLDERLFAFAHAVEPAGLNLVSDSHLRVEEAARHFVVCMGVFVLGEEEAAFMARLRRLDYATLLESADQARGTAEERAAYLKKLQEGIESRFAPRGKW